MTPAVVALAGRRIDAADARPSRFPPANADTVRERIRELLVRRTAVTLVSSAACGADLLALEAAGDLRLRRVVVLPFAGDRFREKSVTDRPGGTERWGPAFDRVLREVPPGDVIVLDGVGEGTEAFVAANARILEEARRLAESSSAQVVAVIVWDGVPRGEDDLTAQFAGAARERGMATVEKVSTLNSSSGRTQPTQPNQIETDP